jgi:hypothetical protein
LAHDWNLEWDDVGVNIITTDDNDVDQVEVIEEIAELIQFDNFDASTCTGTCFVGIFHVLTARQLLQLKKYFQMLKGFEVEFLNWKGLF